MAIALFGGSFDPPHSGHITVIYEALKVLPIEKIIVVPAYVNPFKNGTHAPSSLRLRWLQKIFYDVDNIEISDFEISLGYPVRTIETVQHYIKKDKKIYLIVGADNVATLEKWHSFNKLNHLVTWVVATRNQTIIDSSYTKLEVSESISSTDLRKTVQLNKLPKEVANEVAIYYTRRKNMQERIEKITKVLDNNKAESIEVFDLTERDYFVDYVVIASSIGERHTEALLDHLKRGLKPAEEFLGLDESGDWIVVDLGDILIHIMTPEYRSRYSLETFLSELNNEQKED